MVLNAEKIRWFAALDEIMKDVLYEDMNAVRDEVKKGACELWEIQGHGYTITRAELDHNGNPADFVFVAGIGENARKVIEHFKNGAIKAGFKRFRIHSRRVGMGRYLKKIGFKPFETVYTLEL